MKNILYKVIEKGLWDIVGSRDMSRNEKVDRITEIFAKYSSEYYSSLANSYGGALMEGRYRLGRDKVINELNRVREESVTKKHNDPNIFEDQINFIVFLLEAERSKEISQGVFQKEKITVEFKELTPWQKLLKKSKKLLTINKVKL